MNKLALYVLLPGAMTFNTAGPGPRPAPANIEFSDSHNNFAFRLIDATLHQDTSRNGNMLISPLSVYLSLGMMYNGAAESTRDSIELALHTSGFGGQNLNGLCQDMLRTMAQQDNRSEYLLANAIWCNKKRCNPLPVFGNICERYYYSSVRTATFGQHAASTQINSWVDEVTRHEVPELVKNTDARDALYLAGAASFKSDWAAPFDPRQSHEDLFYCPTGKNRMTYYMRKQAVARVYTDTAFTMVGLPYGNGKGYGLYIILPEDPSIHIRDFLAGFDAGRLYNAVDRMTDQWVDLSLPRWETTYSVEDMRPALRQLGMGVLFNDYGNTDLSGIGEQNSTQRRPASLAVSKAIHKACLSINEAGVDMPPLTSLPNPEENMARPHRSLSVKADHPFMYAIMSNDQRVILFTGIVNDPGDVMTAMTGSSPKQAAAPRHRPGTTRRRH